MIRIKRPTERVRPRALPDLSQIRFGKYFTDYYFRAQYQSGEWRDPRIELLQPMSIHPGAVVFHYGQAVFEGMKAFQKESGEITLFRPDANLRRLNASADRLCMPPIPDEMFLSAVGELVDFERHYVPPRPGSLYLRPTIIGSEACVKVSSAEEFEFFILALPTGDYFGNSGARGIEVLVTSEVSRCAPNGLGNVKAAANYAGTLQVIERARKRGCAQVLFLDACTGSRVEELGGMNVFFVRKGEKTIVTPPLSGTILPGITRDCTIAIAKNLGISVSEEEVAFDDVIRDIRSGEIIEIMACGTAAVITPISAFQFENAGRMPLPTELSSVGRVLKNALVNIQYGAAPDPQGWNVVVPRNSGQDNRA
jgi:branched-chain amino acid aminotransferase